jgi:hypothetical protein
MKVFRSALYDPDKKIVEPVPGRPGMWTIRWEPDWANYGKRYFRKPDCSRPQRQEGESK